MFLNSILLFGGIAISSLYKLLVSNGLVDFFLPDLNNFVKHFNILEHFSKTFTLNNYQLDVLNLNETLVKFIL